MAVKFSGAFSQAGCVKFSGSTSIASDPHWAQTLVLINGDTNPWYANVANPGIYLNAAVTASATSGKFGKGLTFTDVATLPILHNMPSIAGDFTAEMWINNPGTSDTNHYLLSSSGGLYDHTLFINGTQVGSHFTNNATYIPGAIVPIGVWSHVALVRSSGVFSMYLNGTRVATNQLTGTVSINGLGRHVQYDTTYMFKGAVDDIRISTVARYTGDTYTVPTEPFPVG